MKFVSVGFGNLVAADRVVSAASPDSAPIKRLVQDAKEAGMAVDLSCGKKCRAVLVCDSGHVILSALSMEVLGSRLNEAEKNDAAAEPAADTGSVSDAAVADACRTEEQEG